MWYSVNTSTRVPPAGEGEAVEMIVALAPPWPRRSFPWAWRVAVWVASSTESITSRPR
jgi:hypothetical protein